MTVRRHQKREDGAIEVVEEPINNPWLRLVLSTHGWRLIIILFIASMHPVGRSFLAGFGFEFQDTKKITVAAEEAKSAKTEMTQISEAVKEIKADVNSLKANNAILNEKVDTMKNEFQGFKIDFSKWKPADKKIE